MIYPWDIARFRQALDAGLRPPSFEHFRFETVEVEPCALGSRALESEPAGSVWMRGPAAVFGRPALPHCMTGVAAGALPLPPSRTDVVSNGRVVGLTTVLDGNKRLWSNEACTGAPSIDAALARNRSNAEGFVLRQEAGRLLASFFAPETSRRFDKRALFLGNLEINNYGSFLVRVLPQLLMAAAAGCDYDCYIASDRSAWLRQALDLLRLPQKPIFLVQEVCGDVFAEIVVQSTATVEGLLDPETLRRLRAMSGSDGAAGSRRKLFVSRQLSRTFLPQYRLLTNEAEVVARVERRGFEIVHPETLGLAQQLALFSQAACIAGASGSGMLNAMFAAPGGRVLDMEGFNVTVRQHAKVYASTGKDYAFLFGALDPADTRDHGTRRWSVDLDLVDRAVDWLLAAPLA